MKNRPMYSLTEPTKADATDVARRLAQFPLFSAADQRALRTIAEAGRTVTVPAGWSLILHHTTADKAYVVLDGQVEIRRGDAEPIVLGAGDVIGEVAILEGRLRTATCVAASRLEVLHLTADAVRRLYDEVPAFHEALDATVAARFGTPADR